MNNYKYDVYFYEAFAEEENLLKQYMPSAIKAGYTWKTIQETGDEFPPARLISTRTQSNIPLNWADRLDGILSRSTGYNHLLDYRELSRVSLALGYLPLYCPRAVAEQAMLMWMALLRKLPQQISQFHKFRRNGLTGEECSGKTLLVVGVGNIGYEVVKIGRGLDMQVFGVDIVQRHDDVLYVSKEKGLREADVIVCAMNLTRKNRSYFTNELFRRAKRGVIFVNVSRGELSPPQELLISYRERLISAIGLDVFDEESELAVTLREGGNSKNPTMRAILELAKFENVIFTPHNAFNTIQAVKRKAEQSAGQVQNFLEKGKFIWPVPLMDNE